MTRIKIALLAVLCTALCFAGVLAACGGGHEHVLELVPAVEACEGHGYNAHYKCVNGDCGKIFADSNGEQEISLKDIETDPIGHMGGTATCEEKAVCVRCNQPYGELGEHDYSQGYKYDDASGHYAECAVCENKLDTIPHEYNQMVCSEDYLKSEANCESAAVYYKTCVCGAYDEAGETFTYGEKGDHGYEWVTTDDSIHWKECSTCHIHDESVAEGAHEFGTGYVISESKHYHECAVCGKVKDEGAHEYTQETVDEKFLKAEATCVTRASYYKSCICGDFKEDDNNVFETGEAVGGHTPDWVVTDTKHKKVCSGCGEVLVEETTHVMVLSASLIDGKTFTEDESVTAADITVTNLCECGHGGTVAEDVTVEQNVLAGGENQITVNCNGETLSVTVTAEALPRYTLTLSGLTLNGETSLQLKEGQDLSGLELENGKTFLGYYRDGDNKPVKADDEITMPAKALKLEALYAEDMALFTPSDTDGTIGNRIGEHKEIDGVWATRFTFNAKNDVKKPRAGNDSKTVPVNTYVPTNGDNLILIRVKNNGSSDVELKYEFENYGVFKTVTFTAKAGVWTTVPINLPLNVNASNENGRKPFKGCDHWITMLSDISGEVAIDVCGYLIIDELVVNGIKTIYSEGENITYQGIAAKVDGFYVDVYNYTVDVAEGTAWNSSIKELNVSVGKHTRTINLNVNDFSDWIATTFSSNLGNSAISGEYVRVEGTNLTATKYTVNSDISSGTKFVANPASDGNNPNVNGYNVRIPVYTYDSRKLYVFVTNNGTVDIAFRIYAENWGDIGGVDIRLGAGQSGVYEFTVLDTSHASVGCNYEIKMLENVSAGAQFTIYGYFNTLENEVRGIGINNASSHKTSFTVGETFDAYKLAVDVTESDNSNDVNITNFTTDYDGRTFTAEDVGPHTVTVSWNGLTTTYEITITAA